jgi:putative ABC transport system substrate-binding protein
MDEQRRKWLLVAGSAWSACAWAQLPGRTHRLGWVGTTTPRGEVYNTAFVKRLEELGFVEGRNLTFVIPVAQMQPDSQEAMAQELANGRCDLVFAAGNELNLRAAEQATRDTPIVIVANDYDPVSTGHVANMARPGGRVTGVSQLQSELPAKRLEVLRELLPRVRKVAILGDAATGGQLAVTRAAALRFGMELVVHEFTRAPYDYAAAFSGFSHAKAEAVVALASGFFVQGRQTIVDLALQHRLPSIFNNRLWAEVGGLLSYGPNFVASYQRAAELVAKILNGANPAEMPIEQPNAVEMALNLKTAKALGLSPPQSIVLRSDRVID